MKKGVPLCAFAFAAQCIACGPPPQEFASGTAIENVAVVDVAAGSVTEGRTVVVQGRRIAAVVCRTTCACDGVQHRGGAAY